MKDVKQKTTIAYFHMLPDELLLKVFSMIPAFSDAWSFYLALDRARRPLFKKAIQDQIEMMIPLWRLWSNQTRTKIVDPKFITPVRFSKMTHMRLEIECPRHLPTTGMSEGLSDGIASLTQLGDLQLEYSVENRPLNFPSFGDDVKQEVFPPIPKSLGQCPIKRLSISSRMEVNIFIQGKLSENILLLTNLEELDISNNVYVSKMPKNIGYRLKKLKRFYAEGCSLLGELPRSLYYRLEQSNGAWNRQVNSEKVLRLSRSGMNYIQVARALFCFPYLYCLLREGKIMNDRLISGSITTPRSADFYNF